MRIQGKRSPGRRTWSRTRASRNLSRSLAELRRHRQANIAAGLALPIVIAFSTNPLCRRTILIHTANRNPLAVFGTLGTEPAQQKEESP